MIINKTAVLSALDVVEVNCDRDTFDTLNGYIEKLESEIEALILELDCYNEKPKRRIKDSEWE